MPEKPLCDAVHLFKLYSDKRPPEIPYNDYAFYLTPATPASGQISWFRKTPFGNNKIYLIMQEMKNDADIDTPKITPYR